ncbi:hypothetical protein L873DRAFT_1476533 [Choiromyces venosus 120613-1]|uniref:Uncharacterized protein n=1 Tax=Choiromyces venosus 120613-1 TaxID=1336337 RepID=A0A3N4JB11_9PEZI|nr:hypothetical protein L873DRAFT_1476533 [Choiromyces venosus 120613-1]
MMNEIKQLQRGIIGYDANNKNSVIITGSLLMVKGDNPASSTLANHLWKSDFPCRACLFNKKEPTNTSTNIQNRTVVPFRNKACTIELLNAWSKDYQFNLPNTQGIKLGTGLTCQISPLYEVLGFDPHLDQLFECLHTWFLGPLKHITQAFLNSKLVKKYNPELKLFINSLSWDGFSETITGRRVVNWHGSFVGKDYKLFAQVAPFICLQFLQPRTDAWLYDNQRRNREFTGIPNNDGATEETILTNLVVTVRQT